MVEAYVASLKLLQSENFFHARDLEKLSIPDGRGVYCIKVKDLFVSGIMDELKQIMIVRDNPIIYIGKSDRSSLKVRIYQELRAEKHGTFFRSLGAVLGYLPPKGSLKSAKNKMNYKFDQSDTISIIEWINEYLEVSYLELSDQIGDIESSLIRLHTPLLNIKDNSDALPIVKEMRKCCREYACT